MKPELQPAPYRQLVRADRRFPNRPDRRFPGRGVGPWVGRIWLADGLRVGKPAIQQTGKSAVRRNRLVPAVGFENPEMPIRCRPQGRITEMDEDPRMTTQ